MKVIIEESEIIGPNTISIRILFSSGPLSIGLYPIILSVFVLHSFTTTISDRKLRE
jgi:hypothetical protein